MNNTLIAFGKSLVNQTTPTDKDSQETTDLLNVLQDELLCDYLGFFGQFVTLDENEPIEFDTDNETLCINDLKLYWLRKQILTQKEK